MHCKDITTCKKVVYTETSCAVKIEIIPYFLYLWARTKPNGYQDIYLTADKSRYKLCKTYSDFYSTFQELEKCSPYSKRAYKQPDRSWFKSVNKLIADSHRKFQILKDKNDILAAN